MTALQVQSGEFIRTQAGVSGSGAETASDSSAFDPSVVRSALKSWHDVRKLGAHPLTRLAIVAGRMADNNAADSPLGRGAALREVLRDAIEALRPHRGDPDYLDRAWHPYLMLSKQYMGHRSPDDLAGEMCLGRREYYRRQTHALDLLGGMLLKMEQLSRRAETAPQKRQPPFMAPLRPPHTLIGRTRFVNAIKRRLFSAGAEAFCAIHGLPGVGKTALAIELANDAQLLQHFSDGVLWAGLGRRPDVFALLGVWGMALGLSGNELTQLPDVTRRAQAVHAAIGLRRMLLVIDDAWQLETALAFKLGGPHCAHLLTTRMPEIAQVFSGGDVLLAPELSSDDSLTLLRHIAPAAAKANPDEVRQLAQSVGGLPLALTLIGEHLRKASQGASSQRLQRALAQLAPTAARLHIAQPQSLLEQRPDLPVGVPLSLQAVIGVSDDALAPAAQAAIRALAVFAPKPNSFSEAAALAVSAAPAEILDTLIDHGLLTPGDPGRMLLHQTISDYMRLQLAENPEAQRAVHARMVAYFGDYVEAQQKDYAALEMEWQNIQKAMDMAFVEAMAPALIQMAMTLYNFFVDRGLYKPAMKHIEHAVQIARLQENTRALMVLLRNLGFVASQQGMFAEAISYYQEGLELAEASGARAPIGVMLWGLGNGLSNLGNLTEAREVWTRGLEIARETQDLLSESEILNDLGVHYQNLGETKRAVEFAQQSLTIARENGFRRIEILALSNLGIFYAHLGQMAEGLARQRQALGLAREIGHRSREGAALGNIGNIYGALGQYEAALTYYQQELLIKQEIGDRRGESLSLGDIGEAYGASGQTGQAIEYLERALFIAREIHLPRLEEEWLGNLGRIYQKLGRLDLASDYYQQALVLARYLSHRRHSENWLAGLAQTYLALGQIEQARACYEQARDSAQKAGDHEHERAWQDALEAIIWRAD